MSSPFAKQLLLIGGGVCVASFALTCVEASMGIIPSTHTKKWEEASAEYMRFQNMNPIGLGGRKAYDPTYLRKD